MKTKRRRNAISPCRTWPGLEVLENRLVLSTFTVTSLSDAVSPPNGVLTLRQALTLVNADTGRSAMNPDTITFSVTGEIDLTSSLPTIPSFTTLGGPGASSLTIAAATGPAAKLLEVAPSAQNVSISGLTLAGSSTSTGLKVDGGAVATLSNATISGNHLSGIQIADGASLSVSLSTITGNQASIGGGIALGSSANAGASLTISQSTVSNNGGSGIYVHDGSSTTTNHLVISRSTISGNSGVNNNLGGGGIYVGQFAVASILDATITGNSSEYSGGGIIAEPYSTLSIDGSTIAGNQAGSAYSGGGLYVSPLATPPTLTDTIVAGNTTGTGSSAVANDIYGSLNPSSSFNIIGDGDYTNASNATVSALQTYSRGNLVGTTSAPINPLLGPLASNGGPTQTMALLPGSPAIDRGGPDAGLDGTLTTDERGLPRVNDLSYLINVSGGDGRDIGAYEVDGTPAPTILNVNSTADANPPAGVLTLREAIGAADGTISLSTLPAGEVTAGSGYHYIINLPVSGEIDLTTNLPSLLGSIELDGPGASALTIASQGSSVELALGAYANVSISGLTLLGGSGSSGLTVGTGALATLGASAIRGNSNTHASAIGIADGASLWATGDVITGNVASTNVIQVGTGTAGGASLSLSRSTVSGNSGGGISALSVSTMSTTPGVPNSLQVSQSTISGNVSISYGAGIQLGTSALATISDSTIANNQATGNGGGIWVGGMASLTLARSTVAGNSDTGSGSGGGLFVSTPQGGSATLTNTIVAGNTHGSGSSATRDDVSGTLVSTGSNNLIGDGTGMTGLTQGVNGNLVGTASAPINPYLGPLASNGGPTQTMALGVASPALNGGSHEATTLPDQRGVARSTVANIGAYQATFSQLEVATTAPSTIAGASHLVIVEAADSFGQIVFGDNDALTLSSTDPLAVLPSGEALSSGMAEFFATLETAGTQSITATDGSMTGSATGIVVSPGAPASLVIEAGQTQSAIVGTDFASPVQAIVEDAYGNPVPGVSVAFRIVSTLGMASGSFTTMGSNSATVVTDANGVANSPTILANGTTGSFSVRATVSTPALGPASATLTNTAAAPITVAGSPTFSALQNDTTGTIAVASFNDPNLALFPLSGYSATVNWGDGTHSTGVLSVVNGNIVVSSSHTYATPGTFSTVVLLSQASTGRSARATGQASVAPDLAGQATATKSGLHFSHATNLYSGTITVMNTGTSSISGAIEVVLAGLPSTVTLANASGLTGSGLPEILQGLSTPLAPGQSIQVPVQFANTSSLSFDYAIRLYNLPGIPS